MNRAILIGNLTRDPESTTTQSGVSLCKFTIGVKRKFKNADGEYETDFLNVIAWRGLAESCGKYLKKGSKVAVVGAIQTRTYEVDGQKRYATDIVADDVEFIGKMSDNSVEPKPTAQTQPKQMGFDNLKPTDEPLPF